MQATDDKRRSAHAADKATAKKPSFFKMRAQMLDKGRTNTALARTENMWATLKVYASGGENGLHTHPNEDHTFIVLQGSARYYDADRLGACPGTAAARLRGSIEEAQRQLAEATPEQRVAIEQRLTNALDELARAHEVIGALSERVRQGANTTVTPSN